MTSAHVVCAQCGAASTADATCHLCFEALLAFEAERPTVFGAVHHLTVSVYSLQHPEGYRDATLAAWRSLLSDALDGRATIRTLRDRLGRQFGGSARVTEAGALPPAGWPTHWPMTVQNVITPTAPLPTEEEYIERAMRWADTARRTLDDAHISLRSEDREP